MSDWVTDSPSPASGAVPGVAWDALGRAVSGFVERAGQRTMADAVAQAIATGESLIVEAGTGTGKTFAYLVPALRSGGRTILSTGTRNLQDQLYRRDLPTVMAALGLGLRVALLKGRANYVCLHHLERHLSGSDLRVDERADLLRIQAFAASSLSGERSELASVADDAPAWAMASSTRENCLGQDCPHFADCFVMRARQTAQRADVVVVNHHLFCADLALRDEGISELLPTASAVVFDEAHQLPDIAVRFFGHNLSSRQLVDLARDLLRIGLNDARDAADWPSAAAEIEQAVRVWRLAAGEPGRRDAPRLREDARHRGALSEVLRALEACARRLEPAAARSRDLSRLALRSQELCWRLRAWLDELQDTGNVGDRADGSAADPDAQPDAAPLPSIEGAVLWSEVHRAGVTLHATPLSVADPLRRRKAQSPGAWVFVSASLTIGDSFDHFRVAIGQDEARCLKIPSPFDYQNNARLLIPRGCGDPASTDFPNRLVETCWPLLRANHGRAFVLCTSLRMVARVHARLVELDARQPEKDRLTLLVQGAAPHAALLDQFRRSMRPVLVGSASFWEGVDVVGDQLSLVIIDKLPFAPPDDPVLQARIDALRRRGEDPFRQLQLPAAAIALKQGAGRLIRSETDQGLLVVCDERLMTRGYGRTLIRSLPPFGILKDVEAARHWIESGR